MTFRSIGYTVSKKKNLINKKENKEILIKKYIKEFIENEYGNNVLERIKLNYFYEPKEDRLILETNSKILANELILKLRRLTEFLIKNSCSVNQIVVK